MESKLRPDYIRGTNMKVKWIIDDAGRKIEVLAWSKNIVTKELEYMGMVHPTMWLGDRSDFWR